MSKKIFYQDSFLISVMCYEGCGNIIKSALYSDFEEQKKRHLWPPTARFILSAEPETLGVHSLIITVECDEFDYTLQTEKQKKIAHDTWLQSINDIGFGVDGGLASNQEDKNSKKNWLNILINLVSILAIFCLYMFLPASIPLTIGLTLLSFATTAFTARKYLFDFFHNLRQKEVFNMASTVSLGWLLSLAHTLYHSIAMPLSSAFSMMFMSYVMPVTLISLINAMDEIKRQVAKKTKKMQMHGIKSLFPQMTAEYDCKLFTDQESIKLQEMMLNSSGGGVNPSPQMIEFLNNKPSTMKLKDNLAHGMVIQVNKGECFPVDCQLIMGSTVVDASLLTGETKKNMKYLDLIPAGAINVGQMVKVYALNDTYSSTLNQILFRSHRSKENQKPQPTAFKFTYFYAALIILGIIAAIVAPVALGIVTVPLLLQNVIGILFGICPCTAFLAHELPQLLSAYRRSKAGVILRDDRLHSATDEIKTVVFDKTGTLTTGNSQVESSDGISPSLWERIYLLEKHHGAEHPLAKAITLHYEKNNQQSIIQDVAHVNHDLKGRGLSACVQGKKVSVGNFDFIRQMGIDVPVVDTDKIKQGLTAVYVAEDNMYQGVIYIKHEVKKEILMALARLKQNGVKIIMLTGDTGMSAKGFNQQNGHFFEESDIHAGQTPSSKEEFMNELMNQEGVDPRSIWFIGDGLNDAPCLRAVTEKGGISCAMTLDSKAAFFADISLNGSLDYLFKHKLLNQFSKKNILQNQFILCFGAVAFIAFIITFSIAGIAVSPMISLFIMVSTTLSVLFNSYRIKLEVDNSLGQTPSWSRQLMSSDLSISLLVGAGFFLTAGLIIATLATGGLALPVITFTAGVAIALSSTCMIAAMVLSGILVLIAGCSALDLGAVKNELSAVEDQCHASIVVKERVVTKAVEGGYGSFFEPLNELNLVKVEARGLNCN